MLKPGRKTPYPCYRKLTEKKSKGYIRSEEERIVQVHSRGRKVRKPRRKLARRAGSDQSGKDTKFNIRNRKIVYAALEVGLPLSRCYALIGVSQLIFNGWLEYGKDARFKRYYNFRQKIKRIEKQRELEALEVIRLCGSGGITITKTRVKIGPRGQETEKTVSTLAPQWTAAAWFLERTARDVYSKDMAVFTKTPQEYARDIQEASNALFDSVPDGDL